MLRPIFGKGILPFLFLLPLLGLVPSCTYDTYTIKCGTRDYSYADVDNIFTIYGCKACHNPVDGANTSIYFNSQESIRTYIEKNRIAFENSIDSIGIHPMPKGDVKMPKDSILKLKTWICQGMK